jgi:F420-dependent oxidoreductase-like protein
MRLGLMIGYSGARYELPMELIREAERCGYYAVWTSEAWGSDAITPLAYIGAQTSTIRLGTAIMQMPARTPANTAMTAVTLDQLSGGRMLLGLGLSGPQVVEGWHGQSYAKPLVRTREYVSIVRQIMARQRPLQFEGELYRIPYAGEDATGLGKPLKLMLHGRKDIPIYLAAIGLKNVRLCAEIADGWLPIFFSPERYDSNYREHVEAGLAAAGKDPANFDIAPTVSVVIGDDLSECYNQVRPQLALYIGGMGARGKNFYFDLAVRYGFEADAVRIQDLYLTGDRVGAIAAVPDAMIDEVALVGSKERIRDHLSKWKGSAVTTLNVATFDVEAVRWMAELVL